MEKVNYGIIGIGRMGSLHAKRLIRGCDKNARLVAVCDADETRREWAKAKLKNVVVYADYKDMLQLLFENGKLDVRDNNLLGIIGSIKVVERFQERWSKKPLIGLLIKNIDFTDSTSILDVAESILNLIETQEIKLSELSDGNSIGEIIDNLPITDILDFEEGSLNVGIVYELLFGELGRNLITDRAPADDMLRHIK